MNSGETVAAQGQRITNLGERVTALEQSFHSNFKDLSDKFDKMAEAVRTRPVFPWWQAVSGVVGILVVVGGLAYAPIVMGQKANADDITAAEEAAREDLASLRTDQDEKIRELREQQIGLREHERVLQDIDAVKAIASSAVSRESFNLSTGQMQEDIDRVAARLDELVDFFGGQYTLTDAIQALTDRVERMEMLQSRSSQPSPP